MTINIGANLSATYAALEEGNTPAVGEVYNGANGKCYKFLAFTQGAVAAVAGNVASYVKESSTAATCDVSTSDSMGAGVLVSAPADGEYAWFQIKGPATLTTALTAGADGNALTTVGAGDSTLDVSGAVTDAVVAYAVDASAKTILCDFPW